MASYFKSIEHLSGLIEGMLFGRDVAWSPREGDESIVRVALGKLLQLGQSKVTVEEILTVLPEEFQINGDRCDQEGTATVIAIIVQEAKKLSGQYGIHLVFGDTEDDEVDDSVVAEQADDSLESNVPDAYFRSVWYRLKEVDGFPTELSDLFVWLKDLPVSDDLNWKEPNGTVRSLEFWHRTYGSSFHLCKFLWSLYPNWDGISVPKKTDLRFEFEGLNIPSDKQESLSNFMMQFVIPGFIEVVKHFGLVKK